MLRRRGFNAGLVAAAAVPAIGLSRPALAQKKGGEVVMAQTQQPPTLDAQTTTAQASRNITLHVHETLFARDEAGNPKPDLAEGVDISGDGLTYRFKLRSGVVFHNGDKMTSADVKASLERYGKVGGSAFIMKPVTAIETPDDATVVVHLNAVYPGFIEGISSPRAPCAIMPAADCAKPLGQAGQIGTGPFALADYKPDSQAKLVRFEKYSPNTNYTARDGFAGKKTVLFDSAIIRFMPEGGARTAALQTGEVQILETLDVPAAERLKADASVKTYAMMPWSFQTLMINTNWGLSANLDIRRAIQAALDLEEIMAISTGGLYRMQPAWQHPGTAYFPGTEGLAAYTTQDKDKARALLKAAGYKGEELIIVSDNQFSNHIDTATVASEQLRAVGMTVKLDVMDWPTVLNRRTRPDGWNLWPLSMGIEPYEGPYGVVGFFAKPTPVQIKPDDVIEDSQAKLTTSLKLEDRQAAVRQFQARVYDQAISIKCGDIGIYQATRSNVVNYKPYRIPRMWDCWFA